MKTCQATPEAGLVLMVDSTAQGWGESFNTLCHPPHPPLCDSSEGDRLFQQHRSHKFLLMFSQGVFIRPVKTRFWAQRWKMERSETPDHRQHRAAWRLCKAAPHCCSEALFGTAVLKCPFTNTFIKGFHYSSRSCSPSWFMLCLAAGVRRLALVWRFFLRMI